MLWTEKNAVYPLALVPHTQRLSLHSLHVIVPTSYQSLLYQYFIFHDNMFWGN